MTSHAPAESATCRGCRKVLDGKPYRYGGKAYIPSAGPGPRKEAKKNYYGGYVCSKACDVRASLELEQSMPGHEYGQTRVGAEARRHIERNWDGENR